MPALNYKKEFAPLVEIGLKEPDNPLGKRQTIRAYRKDGRDPKPGDTLYHYTGIRTKACRKLGESECIGVVDLGISKSGVCFLVYDDSKAELIDGGALEQFARADGFDGVESFFEFFETTHNLPFYGNVIYW